MTASRTAAYAVFAVCGIAALSGCDQLTRAHFEMVQLNHAEHYDVEKTIGPPSDKMDDMWHYERVDKHLNVMIHFNEEGKVWRKEWHDVLNNDHYDSATPPEDSSTYESTEVRHIQ